MNRRRLLILGALLSLFVARGYGQSAAKGYDAFPTVKTRNIFDPSRKAIRVESESRSSSKERNRPSYFTLTGTMVVEGHSLAFFSGSRSDFSKVIPVGESVAGYKVIAITPIQAEVERDGKSFVMAVGYRLQLEGLTDEIPASELAASASSANASNPSPSPSGQSAPPAAAGDKAEILRRMLERAQAERR